MSTVLEIRMLLRHILMTLIKVKLYLPPMMSSCVTLDRCMEWQYGNECFCGTSSDESDYTVYGTGICHMRCSGDDSVSCGESLGGASQGHTTIELRICHYLLAS